MGQTILDEIKELFNKFEDDAAKFDNKGNKAAGRRARKASITLTKLMKKWRTQSTGREV